MNPSCFALLILLGSSLFTYAAAEEPSEADLEFGRDQVAMFASDRPGAAKVLESSPALKKWLVEAFARKPLGVRIYWDDSEPQGSNAAHLIGQRGANPFLINVASGNITGRDQCYVLMFEHINIESAGQKTEIILKALQRSIDADTFASQILELEYKAVLRAKDVMKETELASSVTPEDLTASTVMKFTHTFDEFLAELKALEAQQVGAYTHYKKSYESLNPQKGQP